MERHVIYPLPPKVINEMSYFVETYSTPFAKDRPWRNGTYTWPSEWYWDKGVLTNNKDQGIEFLYLHFMVWKGGKWGKKHGGGQWEKLERLVHFDYKQAANGFKINEKGFYKLIE